MNLIIRICRDVRVSRWAPDTPDPTLNPFKAVGNTWRQRYGRTRFHRIFADTEVILTPGAARDSALSDGCGFYAVIPREDRRNPAAVADKRASTRWVQVAYWLVTNVYRDTCANFNSIEDEEYKGRLITTLYFIMYLFDVAASADGVTTVFPEFPECLVGHPHVLPAEIVGIREFFYMPQITVIESTAQARVNLSASRIWAGAVDEFPFGHDFSIASMIVVPNEADSAGVPCTGAASSTSVPGTGAAFSSLYQQNLPAAPAQPTRMTKASTNTSTITSRSFSSKEGGATAGDSTTAGFRHQPKSESTSNSRTTGAKARRVGSWTGATAAAA